MGRDTNIKIVTGTAIPVPTGVARNFQFKYINFKDIESISLNYEPTYVQIKNALKGKNTLLRIQTIGETGGLGEPADPPEEGEERDPDAMSIINTADAAVLSNKPCGIVSAAGTIIPQILVPSDSCKYIDNGLVLDTEDELTTDKRENQITGKGYTWKPYNSDGTKLTAFVENKKFIHGERCVGKSSSVFSYSGYISMDGCAHFTDDYPTINTRTYKCDTSSSYSKQGSCAICYAFQSWSGTDAVSAPQLVISLNNSSGNKEITISIPPSGDIIGRVGGDTASGSLSANQEAIMPPQITKVAENLNMSPLFVYPLFSGLVLTNNATQSLKDVNNTVFIPYGDIDDPTYSITINGATKTDEVKAIINDSGNELQFFPALLQESADITSVKLEVDAAKRVKFGTNITVQWIKSYGRFAYCPIYFHRKLKFTLYFKAAYVPEGEDTPVYYFYPAACADVAEISIIPDWTNINESGSSCLQSSLVGTDHSLKESIYKVDFSFVAEKPQRYPIEVFGAAMVDIKGEHPFNIKNANGTFVFDNAIKSQFSWIYSNRSTAKNYLDLIKSVNVQTSMTDMNGEIELDAYPIDNKLDRVLLPQNIGELNLKIDGDTKNIFTGYGLTMKPTVSEGSHTISIELSGVQRKLEDMKLIAAPFWDGDRLQAICAYFESYTKITLKMVNYQCTDIANALPVGTTTTGSTSTWKSNSSTIVGTTSLAHPDFRVPRSFDWRKPAVDFQTGTTCMEAINKLAVLTSCAFVIQPNGVGYFFELNNKGVPYYINNQTLTVVSFEAKDIISLNLAPYIENKYNTFATFAFIQKRKKEDGQYKTENAIAPGNSYTEVDTSSNFPWSRAHVTVENGYVTQSELNEIHANNIKQGISDIYQGNVTVAGNTYINHIYQRVNICGVTFFVISIDHSIDLESKSWTTSYGLTYYQPPL